METPFKKAIYETEQQLKDDMPYRCRVIKVRWIGPGAYVLFTYPQLCPRGCCYDDVYEAIPVEQWINLITDNMKELAFDLKEAREIQSKIDANKLIC